MNRRAFTLVELLVVVAIIGLLTAVATVALGSSGMKARNAQRKENLIQLSKALELYYAYNNGYPSTGGSANWRGNCPYYGGYSDTDPGAWIPGLSPAFMAKLPRDPHTGASVNNPTPTCTSVPARATYRYTSNGTDYKVMALCTPEGTIPASDPFYDSLYPGEAYSVWTPGAAGW